MDAPNGNAAAKQDAEFALGQALYCLKYNAASLAAFDRIVQAGPSHAHQSGAVEWMVNLSHRLPPDAGGLRDIAEHFRSGRVPATLTKESMTDREAGLLAESVLADSNRVEHFDIDLEQPALGAIRDDLYLLAAKGLYRRGNFPAALAYLTLIPAPSPLHIRSKLLEGAIHVRLYQAKSAVDAFREALRASAISGGPDARALQELALISLARTFYSTGQFAVAVKYYARVSPRSADGVDSLFESAWAYFMAGDQILALERIAAFQKEDLRSPAKPESVAEASVLKAIIDADRATAARDGRSDSPISIDPIGPISRIVTDVKAVVFKQGHEPTLADRGFKTLPFDFASRIRNGAAGLPSPAARAAQGALMDRAIGKRFDYVDELTRELAAQDAAPVAWRNTNVARRAHADVASERARAMEVAADLASRRLRRLTEELSQLMKRIITPDFFESPDELSDAR